MVTRLAATLLATTLVAAACTSGTFPDPSTPPPGTTPSPGGTAPAPTATPPADPGDTSRLRVTTSGWRTDFTRSSVDLAEIFGGGPPKDGIPAVDEPRFETVEAARTWLVDESPVIALEVGGEARAYPIAILMWHEIVNDELGGVPVVVTFCPLCHTALVFERTSNGVVRDFGTTGNLRHSDLVMYDRQTESWWQQATGEAIVGELTGTRLTFLPAQLVSLADFERTFPGAEVLSRETGFRRDYGRNPYPGYDRADERPFLFEGTVDGRLAPKELVVTISAGDEALALPYVELERVGVAEVTVGGRELVVLWGPGTASSLDNPSIDLGRDAGATGVFLPEVDGRRLALTRNGGRDAPIRDAETGSTWAVTGLAIDGPLRGKRLTPVVHGDYFWFAWAVFQPDTRIWSAP